MNIAHARPALELAHATLALGGRTVLSKICLTIQNGEFIGVLGPNGAGKTTLMRAILGLVPTTSGTISVAGQPVVRGNPAIGYLPQARSMLAGCRLCGYDFIALAVHGHRFGLPRATAATHTATRTTARTAIRDEVTRVLDLVDGHALAARPLAALSGGERQRLLLAQSLLGRPQLLLLDEPLISLDPHHQRSIVELVRNVQRELGIAVLFSAHELNPLLNTLDRVLYLGGGHAALGTVSEVITSSVLSRLYGSPIEVLHVNGRIFVMSGDIEIEKHDHHHEHPHHIPHHTPHNMHSTDHTHEPGKHGHDA